MKKVTEKDLTYNIKRKCTADTRKSIKITEKSIV